MKFLSMASKVLGWVWLVLAALLILAGTIGIWMSKGFHGVQELLSPFNVSNYLVMFITIAPGVSLLMLSEKITKQSSRGD